MKLIFGMQWAEVLDVLLASIPIYLSLRAIQRATHRRVVVFFLILLTFFCASKVYHWALTSLFLEYFGIVGIIGLFLVFQEDIRRFLESLLYAPFGLRKGGRIRPKTLEILSKTVSELAKKNIGALIVLEGRIPLRHVTKGGFPLDGELSVPLLMSIFDHHSVGHDGAVIIRNQRADRFGVHLPLTKRVLSNTEKVGTRHAAAVGLSEISDALVIVISEETGSISVSRSGTLRELEAKELRHEIEQFLSTGTSDFNLSDVPRRLYARLVPKVAAVGLSLLMWVSFVSSNETQQRTFHLPVTYKNTPGQLIVDDPQPSQAYVALEGPDAAFEKWRDSQRTVSLNLADLKPGTRKIGFSSQDLELPEGIRIKRFDPTSISITAHKAKTLKVPIFVSLVGRRPSSHSMRVKTHPDSVPVLVREEDAGPSLIITEPLEYSRLLQSKELQVKLIPAAKTQFSANTPESVTVTVEKLP